MNVMETKRTDVLQQVNGKENYNTATPLCKARWVVNMAVAQRRNDVNNTKGLKMCRKKTVSPCTRACHLERIDSQLTKRSLFHLFGKTDTMNWPPLLNNNGEGGEEVTYRNVIVARFEGCFSSFFFFV